MNFPTCIDYALLSAGDGLREIAVRKLNAKGLQAGHQRLQGDACAALAVGVFSPLELGCIMYAGFKPKLPII
jgi:hypothetical protein